MSSLKNNFMKTIQHLIIKYGAIFMYAVALMFWLAVFRNYPIVIFAICLGIAWVIIEDGDELDVAKEKRFSREHLKALKKAYRKEAK
jgi:hypothetical protein